MDAPYSRQNGRRDFLAEFRAILRQYTITGACGRKFVRVQRLKEWLQTGPNTLRLLEAAYASINQNIRLPIGVDMICTQGHCTLLVFSILLDLNQGALIHFFHRKQLRDGNLPIRKWDLAELYREIAEDNRYKHILGGLDAETLERTFSERQYAFCPITFEHRHGHDYNSDMVIPVTPDHSTLINDKGGTASVFQISIMEEFIGVSLRAAIKNSRFDPDDGLGPRYRMALKRFEQDNRQFYETEKEAFLALTDQEGMIQYLGEFGHKDKRQNRSNYNILLEYGQLDLDEFFFDPGTIPPVFSEEIISFWDDIFDIAGALKEIHTFKVRRDDVSHEYYGWHADIKPDNILKVDGKFKLADPGFASFKKVEGNKKLAQRAEQREDLTAVEGGTVTYGAPECHFGLRQRKAVPVSRAIDIWSLACVLSVAATWVVLGQQGILQYTRLREHAIASLIDSAQRNPSQNVPVLIQGDYFHDGVQVLPIVTDWHKHLRHCKRESDNITSKVLDIIDHKMLCKDEDSRIKASQLHEELELLSKSRTSPMDQPSQDFRNALRELDAAIPVQSVQPDPPQPLSLAPNNRALSVEDRRERKSKLLGVPLKRTTHRSDALRSSQAASQASTFNTAEDQEEVHTHALVPTIVVPRSSDRPSERTITRRSIRNSSYSGASPSRSSQIYNPESQSAPVLNVTERRSTGGTAYSDLTRTNSAPPKLRWQNPWQARAELDRRASTIGAKSAKFIGKAPKKDDFLTRFFGQRDLHFLIDDGSSMHESWDEATWLLRILLEKAAGQDENGMDMSFMNGPYEVDGSNRVKDFMDKMDLARPRWGGNFTDARTKLEEILERYLVKLRKHGFSRRLVILVLTDGRWEGMADKHAIGKTIAKFAKNMEATRGGSLRNRQVSFQFIRFGNDEEARYRLRRLDDELPLEEAIPDMVDTTDSTGNVNKMLLGSFMEEWDADTT